MPPAPEIPTKTIAYWLPLLTGFIGLLSGVILEWLRDARTHKRESQARSEALRDAQMAKRNEFQRQTLLDLQDAALKAMRTSSEMQHHDVMLSRTGVAWHKTLYSEDLSNRAYEANVQTTLLGVRVRDDAVRNQLQTMKAACSEVMFAANEQDAEASLQEAGIRFVSLNDRIGEVLRKLDDIELVS